MSRTVTLRLEEEIFEEFREAAAAEGRTLSHLIETAVHPAYNLCLIAVLAFGVRAWVDQVILFVDDCILDKFWPLASIFQNRVSSLNDHYPKIKLIPLVCV